MDRAGIIYAALGLAALGAALLPRLLGRIPLSMPMVFVGVGIAVFAIFPQLPSPNPIDQGSFTLHLTEACVIISLMGAGLALDRPIGLRRWGTTWRLLAVTMPLSIAAVVVLGVTVLGLSAASAILLAAALAPTDPVLAGEVQVAEPAVEGEPSDEDEVRFSLTAEAGLNDGLAFPFTYAAVAVSVAGLAPAGWLGHWAAVDLLWRLAAGLAIGFLIGWLLSRLFFSAPSERYRLAEHAEGFVALAATFVAYGVTELAHGYGFVAVFVCACTIRSAERNHGYHRILHQYVEQIERLLTVVVLILFGGAVAGGLLAGVGWREALVAAVFLLVVRPLTGIVGLSRGRTGPRERWVISFFGVRGIGSLFYVAFALEHGNFVDGPAIWAMVGLVVLGSIVIHGVSATPVMALIDRRRERAARRKFGDEGKAPVTPV